MGDFFNWRIQQFLEITIGLKNTVVMFDVYNIIIILMGIYVLLNNDVLYVMYNKLITKLMAFVSKEQTTAINDVDEY